MKRWHAWSLAFLLAAWGGGDEDANDPGAPDATGDAPADVGTVDPGLPGDEGPADPGGDVPGDPGPTDPGAPLRYAAIHFVDPARGTFATDCDQPLAVLLDVQSVDPLVRLRVAGKTLDPGTGEIQTSIHPAFGLNLLTVEAKTAPGAETREHRAFLCGTYAAPETAVAHAADLYLGKGAIGTLSRIASTWLAAADLTALFAEKSPLYDTSLVRVTPGAITLGPGARLALDPGWGQMEAHVEVPQLRIEILVELKGSPSRFYPVALLTDPLRVDAVVKLSLDPDGRVQMDLSDLVFDFVDLKLEITGVAEDLLAVFPDIRERLVDLVEEWLSETIRSYVPAATEKVLARIGDPVDLTFLDRPFQLRFRPSGIQSSPDGLRLALDVAFEGLQPDPAYLSPGVLWTPGDEDWPVVEGIRLSVKDDLLNAVLHEAWRSGLARVTIDQAFLDRKKVEVDLVAGFLGGVLKRLPGPVDPETRIAVKLDAALPPLASLDLPVSGGVRLGIGDLGLEVRAAGDPTGAPLLSLGVTLRLEGEVRSAGGSAVQLLFEALDVALDVSDDDGTFADAENYLEETTRGLLGSLAPLLNDVMGTLPIPSFAGATLADVRVGTDRQDGGVIIVEGDLVEATTGGTP